ncbi:MAG: GatB/YqeY domain-containing protein [Chitinophagaceae bacterium]|nr:GatB/YqeY domain-containing protein [Chitinophagaceae bacterium]MDP1810684.1 GatB/YqeY domain-containing protein [Sediminibacterium sp.]MDP3129367.1 GatB/YqeY domain-containing protein [Sediminibacterium sp.]
MSLENEVMAQMKDAMKAKDEAMLRGLRAIKAEIIKAKTDPGANGQVTEAGELKILQKLVKSRKDSLDIYQKQNRPDLATKESEEIAVIEKFLPKQMSEAELKEAVAAIIAETGSAGPQDMGKLMGIVSKQLAGKADGKTIATVVKELLTQ